MAEPALFPTAEGVAAAVARIDPVFLNTPIWDSPVLDDALGARLVFKDETDNPIRSFKGRGATNFVAARQPGGALVCGSAGNFGQGLAWAARGRGLPLIVFAAETAVVSKVEAMRRLGAEVRLFGRDYDAAKAEAAAYAAREGLTYVEDGADPAIAEGAGTLALEMTEAEDAFDAVLVPLGNGALAAGVGTWFRHVSPSTWVILVAAAGAPAMADAVRTGRIEVAGGVSTIADGIAVRAPIPYAVEACRRIADEVLLVDDRSILGAMALVRDHLDIVVEPAGAAGLAVVVADPDRWLGMKLAIPLCGGNVDEPL